MNKGTKIVLASKPFEKLDDAVWWINQQRKHGYPGKLLLYRKEDGTRRIRYVAVEKYHDMNPRHVFMERIRPTEPVPDVDDGWEFPIKHAYSSTLQEVMRM
jgi:hypothetical protein